MLAFIDDLVCQLFHGKWAEVVSYSRQGAWKCTKPGCEAQARHDRASARSRGPLAPILVLSPRHTFPRVGR